MSIITSQQVVHINKFNTNKTLIGPHRYNVLSVPIPGGMILRDCEVALGDLNVYNSILNITAALGNNQITVAYLSQSTTSHLSIINYFNFTIPDGLYQVSDLNTWLQATLILNGLYSTVSSVVTTFISLAYNPVYLRVQVTASPTTGGTAATVTGTPNQVNCASGSAPNTFTSILSGSCPILYFGKFFANNLLTGNYLGTITELCTVVGANTGAGGVNASGFYPNVTTGPVSSTNVFTTSTTTTILTLPFIPQDTPYNTVLVACNLVASTLMPQYNNIIFDFAPATSAAGTQLTYSPFPDFFDCRDGFYNELRVTFVDENEAPVPIEDPTMSVTLLIRPKPISDTPTETDLGNVKNLGQEFVAPPNQDDVNLVTRLQPKRPRFTRS